MALGRFCWVAVLASVALGASGGTGLAAKDSPMTASGLPVPRYVSLKSDHVNVRAGPTKDNDVAWVYTRSGLPVEITAEFENWRRVRDSEGAEGWVYHSLLSGRRTAIWPISPGFTGWPSPSITATVCPGIALPIAPGRTTPIDAQAPTTRLHSVWP